MFNIPIGRLLLGSTIAAFIGITGVAISPGTAIPIADMRITPQSGTLTLDNTLEISVEITATVPTNVFAGEILFNNNTLIVESISYNTSIADLWAIKPWYENGDGTIHFAGGTTQAGGFMGTDTLLTVTFKSIGAGKGTLQLKDARILQYDGLGKDAKLGESIDAIFTVAPEVLEKDTVVYKNSTNGALHVVAHTPTTDLNRDGKQTITDMSIFLLHVSQQNMRSDFNLDGSVDTVDLSIILNS